MIKKITLASIATMALLFIPAQAENTKCQAGKCGAGMMKKSKGNMKKGKRCPQMMRGGPALLVKLPSPMRMLMRLENDPKMALTAEQKSKLEAQRNEMMPKMMKLKEEIRTLSKEIRQACKNNASAAEQKASVEKLAVLKAQATMLKLTCIDGVKKILNKEQKVYIQELRLARMSKMKTKMKSMKGQGAKSNSGMKMGMEGMKCPNCSDKN